MIEEALCFELSKIEELGDKIYPTNAPQGENPPYLVYIQSYFDQLKTFDSFLPNMSRSYLLNILCSTYQQMKELTQKVKERLMGFYLSPIGENALFVDDVVINNIADQYEPELGLYRGIIDVKISFKEE